jgi:uncharacterized cupin superfamily protein
MRKTTPSEDDSRMGPADVQVPLTDVLGLSDSALNYYELGPGDSFAFGLHAHEKQEEVFYVLEGTVTFHTGDGEHRIGAGELVRFGPGEYQRGVNETDERVRALAFGAPKEPGNTDLRRYCESCGDTTQHTVELADDAEEVRTRCLECDSVTGRFE